MPNASIHLLCWLYFYLVTAHKKFFFPAVDFVLWRFTCDALRVGHHHSVKTVGWPPATIRAAIRNMLYSGSTNTIFPVYDVNSVNSHSYKEVGKVSERALERNEQLDCV